MNQPYRNIPTQNRSNINTNLYGKQQENASFSLQITQLVKLFDEELKEIHWAEKALTRAMPKMIKNATSEELIDLLNEHYVESLEHVKRLELVFEILGKKAVAKKCGAIEGLIKEATEVMETYAEGAMCDAGIISICQKIEHYEIATYGILWQFAKTLGMNDVFDLFQLTLDEEKSTEERLSEAAACTFKVIMNNEEEEEQVDVYAMW